MNPHGLDVWKAHKSAVFVFYFIFWLQSVYISSDETMKQQLIDFGNQFILEFVDVKLPNCSPEHTPHLWGRTSRREGSLIFICYKSSRCDYHCTSSILGDYITYVLEGN